ncbi:MAG: NADH-quinone oxidoreductase subunit J, partial [Ardenticatenaceae bacterium]
SVPSEPSALAEALFSRYLLPFEVTSLLLLVAMIGAVVLAKRTAYRVERQEELRLDEAIES